MAEENNTDKTRQEFQSIAEETAAIFGNTLRSIASNFSKELRDNANILDDLGKSLLRGFKNDLNSLARSASSVLDIQQGLLDGSIKQRDIAKARQAIDLKLNKLLQSRNELILENGRLTKKQEEDYKRAVAVAREQQNVLEKQEATFEKINQQLGVAGGAFKVLGTALKTFGLSDPFQDIVSKTAAARTQLKLNNEELDSINNKSGKLSEVDENRKKQLTDQNTKLKTQSSLSNQVKEGFKEILSVQNLIAAAGALILKSILEINKAQTDFRRNVGASLPPLDTLNTSLISSTQYIKQANSLVEQFGFNAAVAFSKINIQEATELTNLMGLSAEEANNLAMFSQANGESLKDNAAQAYKNISPLLSQRKVLQEVANIAPSIALSFGGSAENLAEAASNARLLGLNLSQVDKIAEGLLNIEQSIASEFEAEVITGRQLNLERARFFALTNNIDGVTKEIAANQEIIDTFATGTRIEQEAIAGALGLSRDEISKMIFNQKILEEMSIEEAARQSGMSIEDAKRLSIQNKLNVAIAKMGEALAGPAELIADFLVSVKGILPLILTITAATKAYNIASTVALSLQARLLQMKNKELSKEAAISSVKALGNPIAAAAGIAAAAIVAGAALYYTTKADDMISSPTGKGGYGDRLLLGPEGAISLNNKDTVIAGTNLGGNQTPQPQIDYDKLANAIASGAERGTSRASVNTFLDGNRVSSNLQVSNVIEQRQYAV